MFPLVSLILSIICSALISILMRYGENRIQNKMGMFIANYAVCSVLSRVFIGRKPLFTNAEGWWLVALFGAIAGVLYLVSFVLLQKNISKNGLSVSAVFMKLGVLVPTVMALVIFHEQPHLTQFAGIAIAIFAVILINYKKESGAEKQTLWLIMLLLGSGFADAMANIFDELGNIELKDHYLLITFLCALLSSVILFLKDRKRITGIDILLGVCIGVPNYFSSRFLLAALQEIPATIVYPVFSVMTVVIITLAGIILFKEKLDKRKNIAMGLILVALVLLNI